MGAELSPFLKSLYGPAPAFFFTIHDVSIHPARGCEPGSNGPSSATRHLRESLDERNPAFNEMSKQGIVDSIPIVSTSAGGSWFGDDPAATL